MESHKLIGIFLIALSIIVGVFGIWIKTYNDGIAQVRVNETGSCYLPDGTCLHTTSDSIMYSSIGIAILIFAIGMYLVLRTRSTAVRKTPTKRPAKKPLAATSMAALGDDSKKIFGIITQSNGAVLQGEIVTKSGMSKVKVSRALDKLEMQGLIERRRHGMSNLVVLKSK